MNEFEGRGEGHIAAGVLPVVRGYMQCARCDWLMEVICTIGAPVKCSHCGSPDVYDFEGMNILPPTVQ